MSTPTVTITRHTGYSIFRYRYRVDYGTWSWTGTTITHLGARWIVRRELRKQRRR
jgi:hypothetical protein